MQVLRTRKSGSGINKGFRTNGKEMFTCTQQRDALSYFYIKRKVGSDNITTFPLDI